MSLDGQAEEERNLAVGEMMVVEAAEAETQRLGEEDAGIIGGGNLKQNLSEMVFARPDSRDVNQAGTQTAASVRSVDYDILKIGDLARLINPHRDVA